MKVCPLVRHLTEEHRAALSAAEGLRRAVGSRGELQRATARFLDFWRDQIVPHHRREEEVLLPELAQWVPEGDAVIVLTLADHVALRRLVRQIEGCASEEFERLSTQLVEKLAEHIRFEEETLFPALEEALGRPRLAELAGELAVP